MIYRIKAYANLRHYLPEKNEEFELKVSRELSVGDIINQLNIPPCEICLIKINEKIVEEDFVPDFKHDIEIFPVLSGG